MRARLRSALAALMASLAVCGCGGGDPRGGTSEPIGLYTSLPILWRETGEMSGLLDADAPRHWAIDVLESHGRLAPVDDLASAHGALPLAREGLLVMAQPRPLSPDENVALDNWVRHGGRVLLFADPMLTAHSAFALGDKRRPQDVVLLSPILARWGLVLQFDEAQPAGERLERLFDSEMPVNLPGRFMHSGNSRECAILGKGLAADCRIGEGHVIALADAAMLEDLPGDEAASRRAALEALLDYLEIGD